MRFHFISFPPSTSLGDLSGQDSEEVISCLFRDASAPTPTDGDVLVTWRRAPGQDWNTPSANISGSVSHARKSASILVALDNFAEKALPEFGMTNPDELLTAIARTHGEHAVFDPSVRKYIPVRKIDKDNAAWRGCYVDTVGVRHVVLVVKAETEEQARAEIGRRLMALVNDADEGEADKEASANLLSWMNDGRKIEAVKNDAAILVHPLFNYVTRAHAEAARMVKETLGVDKPAPKAQKKK